jgi:hypothetical protein
MNARLRGRPFEPGRSGNPGGRPRIAGELRDLARTHAPEGITELGRLAVKAKIETARIAAIRACGEPTQYLAADNEVVRNDLSEEELRVKLFADFERIFPEYEMVPRKRLTAIAGTNELDDQDRSAAVFDK